MAMTEQEKHRNKLESILSKWRALAPQKHLSDVASEFQQLVKLKAADENGNCVCFTCEETHSFKSRKLNAGHFVSREYRATMFDFTNCHPQCVRCNGYRGGAMITYTLKMIDLYGREHIELLLRSTTSPKKYSMVELAELKISFANQSRDELKRITRCDEKRTFNR